VSGQAWIGEQHQPSSTDPERSRNAPNGKGCPASWPHRRRRGQAPRYPRILRAAHLGTGPPRRGWL